MIELGAGTLSLIFLVGIMVGILTGFHIALVLMGVAGIIGYFTVGPAVFFLIYIRASVMILNYNMLAIPLFTFMGVVLSKSMIAERLYRGLYLWLGGLNGGLALSTVVLGTILAAGLGVVQASVSMLTTISLGPMVKRGYGKDFAAGAICAGGTLGILIPPSIMLVILGMMASLSIGKLFFGAFIPGLVLLAAAGYRAGGSPGRKRRPLYTEAYAAADIDITPPGNHPFGSGVYFLWHRHCL